MLAVMTLYRFFFFFYFARFENSGFPFGDVCSAFWLGLRCDLSTLAFINVLPVFVWTILLIFRSLPLFKFSAYLLKLYYFFAFAAVTVITAVDFGFFSVFNEHINILIFKILSDDLSLTSASVSKEKAFIIALIVIIVLVLVLYKIVSWTIRQILNRHCLIDTTFWNWAAKTFIVIASWAVVAFFARGSLADKPFCSEIPDRFSNAFINKLPIDAPHSLAKAVMFYREIPEDPDAQNKNSEGL